MLLHKPLMQGKNEQDQRDKICELLGTPDEENWPNFSLLPGAKHVRYKKKQSVLREKIPLFSYTGESTLSDRGYALLKGLLAYDPAKRLSARESLEDAIGYFDEAPKACKSESMPTYPSTHELPKGQKKRARSRKRFPGKSQLRFSDVSFCCLERVHETRVHDCACKIISGVWSCWSLLCLCVFLLISVALSSPPVPSLV